MKFAKVANPEEFMGTLEPEKRKIVEQLRRLIKESNPGVEEVIKWSTLAYQKNGKTIGAIMVHKEHLNLQLWRGAEVKDKANILEGVGKGMRHVKILSASDLKKPALKSVLREAGRLE